MELNFSKEQMPDPMICDQDRVFKNPRLNFSVRGDKSLHVDARTPNGTYPLTEAEGRALLAFLQAVYA